MIIRTSQKTLFNFQQFLTFFFYHMLQLFLSNLGAVPIIWALEKGNTNILYNLSFLGGGFSFWAQVFSPISTLCGFVVFAMYGHEFEYMLTDGELSPSKVFHSFLHFIVVLMSRAAIIAVKYGFYSAE